MDIAIVDDDDFDRHSVLKYCQEYVKKNYPEAESTVSYELFSSGEQLLDEYEKRKFDLIILDIYMGEISGIETAKRIRTIDSNVSIVFLTSSEEHLLDGYRVFAVGYFIKPITDNVQDFAETFNHIFPELLEKNKGINIRINGTLIDIPYNEIIYIDIGDGHALNIHLATHVLSSTMNYAECCDLLLVDKRFLECHHRIIINMDYVESMDADDFTMTDGSKVPISRRKRQGVKLVYMNYMVNK
ncbi:MAG: LytTR family DNA-binding domain-containing protein [Anaerovibrio sp.]|uniref:LytR/AlgR family response regulator transcription factor n=1 Tax=Anaerovibrio sp. TaxID=1872532 RepID=UPI0025CC521F|nr:LytTR family DNA-binding domain-containing protein [Anaerovibrio sp.]MCR5175950.1 LytTR family DNA-binding domain-containing protein [Anaerovibrio sp.]